jgi:hypothetical protein
MTTNDKSHHSTVEDAHERAQDDVRTGKQADVEAAGYAQMEAERKEPSHVQAQARDVGEAKANADEQTGDAEDTEEADLQPQNQGWQGLAADGHREQANRQLHQQQLHSQEAGHDTPSDSQKQATEEGYNYPVTEQRMDAFASAATADSPEARKNEAGMTDNISVHGAYSDNPDEVDQISGPPMESVSKEKVEKK